MGGICLLKFFLGACTHPRCKIVAWSVLTFARHEKCYLHEKNLAIKTKRSFKNEENSILFFIPKRNAKFEASNFQCKKRQEQFYVDKVSHFSSMYKLLRKKFCSKNMNLHAKI